MGILGLLIRGTRDAVQEHSAKNNLEKKLGRKVSKEELYSLGAHLDAAEPMPLQSAPRETAMPVTAAKPPMSKLWLLLIAGVLVLFVGIVGVAGSILLMSERSDRVEKVVAVPRAPARPVRPTR